MKKKMLAIFLVFFMIFTIAVPALAVEGTIDKLKITRKNIPAEPAGADDPKNRTPIADIEILSPNLPVAGVYPVGAYKYSGNRQDIPDYKSVNGIQWEYTETIEWSPQIRTTFETNKAYTAIVTLTPNNGKTFAGKKLEDVAGIPAKIKQYATTAVSGNFLVITFHFPATGTTTVGFEEFQNTLFFDDFTGSALDSRKWADPIKHEGEIRGGSSVWEKRNIRVNEDALHIRFAKEDANSNKITTGMVESKNKFENSYGYYEAKIKYPKRSGAWGAFWLMGDTVGTVGDGGIDGTEIDIVELSTVHKGGSNSALHWDGYGSAHKSTGHTYGPADYASPTGIYDGQWHTYALQWTPFEYIFYIDDKAMWSLTNTDLENLNSGICQNPLYIMFSVESHGDNTSDGWGGPIAPGVWEDEMLIDYVVVYDRPKNVNAEAYAKDYVTLSLDTVQDGQGALIKATLKNVDVFGKATYSGSVTLDTPIGITKVASQRYENLAYGETAFLYFNINKAVYNASEKALETINFKYKVDGISFPGSAQIKFGYLDVAPAVKDDLWANSIPIDFRKGIIDSGASASTLNPEDLSATGKLAWDEDTLYAQIVVSDDIHSVTHSPGNRWNDDGVQITVGNSSKFREMEFTLPSNGPAQYCYNATGGLTGTGVVNQSSDSVVSSITRDEISKTTTYNVAIHWAYVGINGVTSGTPAQISICINDNDGGARKYLAYFDGIATGSKGQGMGGLVLLPKGQVMVKYTVKFDVDGAITAETVIAGETVWEPVAPRKDGYEFMGWYLNDKPFDFDTAVTRDITLVARWQKEKVSNVEFLQSIAADVRKNDLKNENLVLQGKVLKLVFGDMEIVLSTNANNKNLSGKVYLGDGWWLVFDIKGNGSNVKDFKLIQNRQKFARRDVKSFLTYHCVSTLIYESKIGNLLMSLERGSTPLPPTNLSTEIYTIDGQFLLD